MNPQPVNPLNESARSLLKSPMAPLPHYNSEKQIDLHKFFLQFEETLSKFPYTDYDKLLLLKQQVSGRASILLDSLESDKQSYNDAKKLLIEALASPVVRKFNIIKQFSEIKLPNNADPFEYISRMKYIMESIKNLKIDVDEVMQYFFWNGLNDEFQKQLVQITNKARPSVSEISEHFFEACERYENLPKNTKYKKESYLKIVSTDNTMGLAVNVDYDKGNKKSFRPCSICSKIDDKEASHNIQNCKKFETALDKVNQLKTLQGCIKCSSLNHVSKDCKFRFRSRCYRCKQWHMNFLCTSPVLKIKWMISLKVIKLGIRKLLAV